MAITQIAFEIPPEIQAGIDAGTLLRFGGIIRDRAGHIVKHLEEVSIPEADNSAGESTIVQFAKKNKYFYISNTVTMARFEKLFNIIYFQGRLGCLVIVGIFF